MNRLKRIQTQSVLLSWIAIAGVAGSVWIGIEGSIPDIAQAYTSRISISIDRLPGESYNTLIRRAEAIARTAAQRGFDDDILVTNVVVTIVGESEGSIAPLLLLDVSREQWRSRPQPQQWITYFSDARELLRLGNISDEQLSSTSTVTTIDDGTLTIPAPASSPSGAIAPPPPPSPISEPADTTSSPESELAPTPNPVQIDLPAAPSGQLGLPRSILR